MEVPLFWWIACPLSFALLGFVLGAASGYMIGVLDAGDCLSRAAVLGDGS